jgi:2-polyprenyl-3-methyl-5-hydroxy-6-metoxy-1,4-benzoquinol methylase
MGCGHGHVGLFFEEIGSDVLFLDARKEHIEVVQNKTKAKTIIIDQNKPWYLGKFDILIHWGVLYHLDDWRSDLECCSRQSDLIF